MIDNSAFEANISLTYGLISYFDRIKLLRNFEVIPIPILSDKSKVIPIPLEN